MSPMRHGSWRNESSGSRNALRGYMTGTHSQFRPNRRSSAAGWAIKVAPLSSSTPRQNGTTPNCCFRKPGLSLMSGFGRLIHQCATSPSTHFSPTTALHRSFSRYQRSAGTPLHRLLHELSAEQSFRPRRFKTAQRLLGRDAFCLRESVNDVRKTVFDKSRVPCNVLAISFRTAIAAP